MGFLFTVLDKYFFRDYKKLKYKYKDDFNEFIQVLEDMYYFDLPLCDFSSGKLVFIENHAR